MIPEGHDVGASLQLDAEGYQDGKAYVIQAPGHQLGKGLAGALGEGARDRGLLLNRARIGLDLGTNRLPSAPVAPVRDPGEHPLEDDARERVTVGEVAVHGKADLAGAVGGAYPGALDPDPPPAEGDLAGLVAMAHGLSLGVMAALGADDLADLFFHQLGQHTETDADRQRHEPLLGDAHQLPERLLHPWRQRTLIARDGLRGRYVSLHGGSLFDLADRPEGSHWERTEEEDRRPQVLRATGQPPNDLYYRPG